MISGSKKYMQLNSKITEANWNNEEGCWSLTIVNPRTGSMRKDWAHVFVNGTGEIILAGLTNSMRANHLQAS